MENVQNSQGYGLIKNDIRNFLNSEPGQTTLNESSKPNLNSANFFIPVREEKCKVMLAGSGDQCKIIKFFIEKKYQEQYAKYDSTRREEPTECCIII